ncbi:MAG: amylo-alpha-1,6-glucosidase [Chloroflexi bacterium]|nr:amylo-alpha-1,6-glucosidase [Chloroflexota bacterium]
MVYSLVSDSIVTTSGTVFMVSDQAGNVRPGSLEGLFALDTRFLSEFQLTINGEAPAPLRSGALAEGASTFYATSGNTGIDSPDLTVLRERYVSTGLHEEVSIQNHTREEQRLLVGIDLDSDFADLFEVRRGSFLKAGSCRSQLDEDGRLRLIYERGDFHRETHIVFSQSPEMEDGRAIFKFTIEPSGVWRLCLSILPVVGDEPEALECVSGYLDSISNGLPARSRSSATASHAANGAGPFARPPMVESSHADLNAAYDRAVADLQSLTLEGFSETPILAAGLPWFMAIFGRDSILSALQTKMVAPELMIGTLETLALFQATEVDAFRESEPGKIPHEIREGELSLFGEVPHSRYYGTVDATPLFLILLREAEVWTGDHEMVRRLLPAAEAALSWIDYYGDADGDGFVEYAGSDGKTLKNQCWKDSSDSISFADGTLATGPIAVAEVQGYVYQAKLGMSSLFADLGDTKRAETLRAEADKLKRLFNDAFWMPDEGYYALALDGQKRQVNAIASNAGHCLWSGIIDADHASSVAERLVAPDMFTGWGVRTLSSEMGRYHPISYHNGSVWPHDTSIVAAGLSRYGFYRESEEIIGGLLDATSAMPGHRPPELFAGHPRGNSQFPVPYPSSNAPQAWAAGAIVYSLETLLRLHPDNGALISDRPSLSRPFSITGIRFRDRVWDF